VRIIIKTRSDNFIHVDVDFANSANVAINQRILTLEELLLHCTLKDVYRDVATSKREGERERGGPHGSEL